MKRFLSWVVLILFYFLFAVVLGLDQLLLGYVFNLYDQLGAFMKLVVIFVGGTFIGGLALAPLFYGIPFTYAASEAVCPSRKGVRYIVWGIFLVGGTIFSLLTNFYWSALIARIFVAIYGVGLIMYGNSHSND